MFVGNLSYDVTREELLEAFGAAGKVVDAKVPTDRETGRPRGFAFVEFETDEGVERAVALLNGQPLRGRPLRVNEAEDRPPGERGPRPGGFGPRPGGGAGGGFTPRPGGPGPRPGGFGPRPGGFGPRPGGFGAAPPPMGEESATGERRRRPMTTTDRDRNKNFKAKEPRRVEKRRRNNTDDDFDI